ncbi:hypothetical protein KUTeg_007936 [Tegillarca granosa]|uniref:Transmembrane protein n=1 Tax=Tegillarca granosa TaxID=220873 RepID=A0ABQ9FER0_TEGGR|nr:hypothetical protein KUTeg_007936 [Tegillarca granosa]
MKCYILVNMFIFVIQFYNQKFSYFLILYCLFWSFYSLLLNVFDFDNSCHAQVTHFLFNFIYNFLPSIFSLKYIAIVVSKSVLNFINKQKISVNKNVSKHKQKSVTKKRVLVNNKSKHKQKSVTKNCVLVNNKSKHKQKSVTKKRVLVNIKCNRKQKGVPEKRKIVNIQFKVSINKKV